VTTLNFTMEQPRRRSGGVLHWLSRIFLLAGISALAYAGYVYSSAYVFQSIESISFDRPRSPSAPSINHIVPEGGVLGRIEIGRLGLSAIVVEGDSPSLLRRAVGHVPKTAMPGESGNIALTAHRDTFFRPLRKIQKGDVITLATMGGQYLYAVESTAIVSPSATEVLQSSGKPELTLITCYPFYYVGPAPRRFVVRARKIDKISFTDARSGIK
jgi:sortase A